MHATVFLAKHYDFPAGLRTEGAEFKSFLSGQVALPYLACISSGLKPESVKELRLWSWTDLRVILGSHTYAIFHL